MSAPLPLVLISAVFPPSPMAGAPRLRAMVRYLPAHGVVPLVVATDAAQLPPEVDRRVSLCRVAHHGPPALADGFRGDHLPWWRRLLRDLHAEQARRSGIEARLWTADLGAAVEPSGADGSVGPLELPRGRAP